MGKSSKNLKAKIHDYQMILVDSLDPRDGEANRDLKLVEKFKIEEVKLFGEFDPKLIRIRMNFLEDFKQKLI